MGHLPRIYSRCKPRPSRRARPDAATTVAAAYRGIEEFAALRIFTLRAYRPTPRTLQNLRKGAHIVHTPRGTPVAVQYPKRGGRHVQFVHWKSSARAQYAGDSNPRVHKHPGHGAGGHRADVIPRRLA